MNGAAALHLAPAAAPECASKDAPDGERIDLTLGRATADGAISLAQALDEYRRIGALPPASKAAGADAIARVANLQLAHEGGDDDFTRQARDAGKCVLRQYFDADFFAHHSQEVDTAIDVFIDELLTIVAHVVKDERVFRAVWAH